MNATTAPIPAIGFGTYELEGETCYEAVSHALAAGYRHLDTAQMYGNETQVGRAIRDSSLSRDQIFLVTKLALDATHPDEVRPRLRESLKRLATDAVDLLLIHWPDQDIPLADTLGAMMDCQAAGMTRFLGVSNFTPRLIEEALTIAPIVCNQVEHHPFLQRKDLWQIAHDSDTALVAYSPLAQGAVHDDPTLKSIGERHGKTAAQVALRWQVQQPMVVAIPRSGNPAHIRANLEVFDFDLSGEEMAAIADLARGERLVDPSWAPRWGEPAPAELTERRRRKLAMGRPERLTSQPADHTRIPDAP